MANENKNVSSPNNLKCNCCKGPYTVYNCNQFLNFPISDKVQFVKNANLCNNFLWTYHFNQIKRCNPGQFRKYKQLRNTLLHGGTIKNMGNPISEASEEASTSLNSIH